MFVAVGFGTNSWPTYYLLVFPKAWGKSCVKPQLIPMTGQLKQKLVNMHNQYRQKIASGGVPNYDPAVRMATMVSVQIISTNKERIFFKN